MKHLFEDFFAKHFFEKMKLKNKLKLKKKKEEQKNRKRTIYCKQ